MTIHAFDLAKKSMPVHGYAFCVQNINFIFCDFSFEQGVAVDARDKKCSL